MADLGIIFLRRRYPIHWYQSSYIFITGSMPFRYFWATLYRAVYTCIKKPESFVHSGFSWEVARQLPLNTAKNLNRKTHLRSGIFWNSAGFSGFFCQCKKKPACSNLAGIIRVFGHVVRDLLWNHPTAAHNVMRTTYSQR